ncbi:MAG: 16S rRNA (adenine(1518)-N(6)/adenine(1519)-N(6))-dimethyltransferase RsmA [Acidobacteriota bacterium]
MPEKTPAKKSLGQHFLVDLSCCRRIVRLAEIEATDQVIEIGAGTGQLTQVLLQAAGHVTAIEFDRDLVRRLQERWPQRADNRLSIVQGNVLNLRWSELLRRTPVKIVGNLPYNISTRIIKQMIEIENRFHSFTFMIQKEVAARVLAKPGDRDYGYFSILVEAHFQRVSGFDVGAESFRPSPGVRSHVMKLIPAQAPPPLARARRFDALLRRAFRHRRKTLWNNLRSASFQSARLSDAFAQCGVERDSRPGQVTLEQYLCLARVL